MGSDGAARPPPIGLTHRPPALHDSATTSTVQPLERTCRWLGFVDCPWTLLFTRISRFVGHLRPATAPDRSPDQERGGRYISLAADRRGH